MPCCLFPCSGCLQGVETSDAKAVTHHQPTDGHPVPKQRLLWKNMMLHGMEYVFGKLESAVPTVSLPRLLATPSLLAGGAEQEQRRPRCYAKLCSAMRKAPVCYPCCFGHRYATRHYMGCYEENELPPSQAQYNSLYQTACRLSDFFEVISCCSDKEAYDCFIIVQVSTSWFKVV